MTEYGIVIKNAGGRVIIDSNYNNYAYVQHGNISLTADTLTNLNITDTPQNILCAIRPTTSGHSSVYSYVKSGSNYTDIKFISDVSQSVPYMLMANAPQQPTNTGYGMVVYNSSGDPTFNSNEIGYCNVAAVHVGSFDIDFNLVVSCSAGGITSSPHTFTVEDADNNYFILLTRKMVVGACPTSTIGIFHTALKKIDSKTLQSDMIFAHSYTDTNVTTNFSFGAGASFSSNYILEIKKPPSI